MTLPYAISQAAVIAANPIADFVQSHDRSKHRLSGAQTRVIFLKKRSASQRPNNSAQFAPTLDELIARKPMSKEAFEGVSVKLPSTIKELFERGDTIPTILLLYTTIDIFASLARPTGQEDTDRDIFKDWVDKYMLPDSGLPCNADDIYAARCGLLHTLTAESRESRLGHARNINYVGANESPDAVQAKNDPKCIEDIFVDTTPFVNAFFKACSRFREKVCSDPDLQNRIYLHAAALMVETRSRLT
jgi:hypothetical protein